MLQYETLVDEALSRFPEFKRRYGAQLNADIIDADAGVHTVFSYVFVPMLQDAIYSGRYDTLRAMLGFLEEMEESTDKKVCEVAECTVLEECFSELMKEDVFKRAGSETQKSLVFLQGFMV